MFRKNNLADARKGHLLTPCPRHFTAKARETLYETLYTQKENDNIFIDEGARMKKAILFDWNGVLVRERIQDNHDRNELYNKVLKNTATQDEVKLLVQSFEKYEPLWDMLPKLIKHFKLCVVNNGPKATMDDSCGFPIETEALNMKFIHWDTFEAGFEKFRHYLREDLELDI